MYNELCSTLMLDEILALEFEHEDTEIKILEEVDSTIFYEMLQELNNTLIENNDECFNTIVEIHDALESDFDEIISECSSIKKVKTFVQSLIDSLADIDKDSLYIDSVKSLEDLKTYCRDFILKNLGPFLGTQQSSKLLQLLRYSSTYALSKAAKIINCDVKVQQKLENKRVKNEIFDELGIHTMINNLNVNAKDLRNSLEEYENVECLPLRTLLNILDNLSNTSLNGNEEDINAWLLDFMDKANIILERLEKFTPEDLEKKIFANEMDATTKIVSGLTVCLDYYGN